jgi:hypothetical protein
VGKEGDKEEGLPRMILAPPTCFSLSSLLLDLTYPQKLMLSLIPFQNPGQTEARLIRGSLDSLNLSNY